MWKYSSDPQPSETSPLSPTTSPSQTGSTRGRSTATGPGSRTITCNNWPQMTRTWLITGLIPLICVPTSNSERSRGRNKCAPNQHPGHYASREPTPGFPTSPPPVRARPAPPPCPPQSFPSPRPPLSPCPDINGRSWFASSQAWKVQVGNRCPSLVLGRLVCVSTGLLDSPPQAVPTAPALPSVRPLGLSPSVQESLSSLLSTLHISVPRPLLQGSN